MGIRYFVLAQVNGDHVFSFQLDGLLVVLMEDALGIIRGISDRGCDAKACQVVSINTSFDFVLIPTFLALVEYTIPQSPKPS